jgi:2-methylisocitrate lyase-like PEP mutase family enzyme
MIDFCHNQIEASLVNTKSSCLNTEVKSNLNAEHIEKAKTFLDLHSSLPILLIANVWDVASAKIFELERFRAIGTSSAAISASLGFPDGQYMTKEDSIRVLRRIARQVDLPVSADIEAGYADSTEGVVTAAEAFLNAGAVGINLEDGTGNVMQPLLSKTIMKERIKAIRDMSDNEGIHLFINARTDVFLSSSENINQKIEKTVDRANAYVEAGADGVFVPDIEDLYTEEIKILVREIHAPLNILAGAGKPKISELEAMGVARISFGPRIMRAGLALIRKIAREIQSHGTYTYMTSETISYSEVNNWFKKKGE